MQSVKNLEGQHEHTLVPLDNSFGEASIDTVKKSGDIESDSDESMVVYDFSDTDKPFTSWSEADFLDKPNQKIRGVNKLFQFIANVQGASFRKQPVDEDVEPVCCDGVFGLMGLTLLMLVDIAYVAYATYRNNLAAEDDVRLIWLSAIFWLVILIKIGRRIVRLGKLKGGCWAAFVPIGKLYHTIAVCLAWPFKAPWRAVWKNVNADKKTIKKRKALVKMIFSAIIMLGFTVFCLVYYVLLVKVENLVSLSGIALLVLVSICLSRFPGKINWQPVLNCLFLQLLLAFLTLKTRPGYITFEFLGQRMAEFLRHSDAGATFVFGNLNCFAFNVLPVVVFFSSFMAINFHLGIVQLVIDKPSAAAAKLLKTTSPETLNAIANIFVSMTEAPLITRPYLPMLTNSELHAIFVNGFASVSGSVMAAFIGFGIPPNHLLIACVISAPAALATSKIMYPETKISPMTSSKVSLKMKSPYQSVLEAAMVGAMDAIPICGGVVANLIAFLSIYNFLNRTLVWMGKRACLGFDLTFEVVFSYILWPISYTMGVPTDDALKVAELIGIKTFLNEFAAYDRLGTSKVSTVTISGKNACLNIGVNISLLAG
ncbi:unnamed protein product [Mesocestoides corti]|uniref:Concentrative nucleoside transporter N-terminal domain-containing protein n=1 Tax=Mesocestoides corti TaxID=53468 RepID=A0A158QTX4_MESCO|nr:unnamed protein product [Mesocestoides corti]